MKYATHIAAVLLFLIFSVLGLAFLLNLLPTPAPPPEGTPMAMFMGAFFTTGYLTFVKVMEVIGGILVVIPRTRNLGLLVLGPIIVNILAFHVFIAGAASLLNPMIIIVCLAAAFLLWVERKAFLGLINR